MVTTGNLLNQWRKEYIRADRIHEVIPLELERAIASFYPKKKIPLEIRDKIMLHCETISKVIDYCVRNQTDDLPNTEENAKFL